MSVVNEIVEKVEKMSVLEVSELVKALEDKFGVSAAMPMMAMSAMPGGGGAGAAVAEEQTEFDVILTSGGEKKIQVIKVVRELTGLGLKESKDLVDGAPPPLKTKIAKAEAEDIRKKIEEQGGVVEIK